MNKETHQKIIAKAWKDPEYKKLLLTNPRAAFAQMGVDFPENVSLMVVQDDATSYTFVLPAMPAKAKSMSEKELSALAGGLATPACGQTYYCP